MRAGFKPAAVSLLVLLADAEGNAQLAMAQGLDIPHQPFDVADKRLILPFARLERQGTVLVVVSPFRHRQDIVPVGVKPLHLVVVPTDAAVQTVLDAAVGKLNEAAVIDDAADVGRLDLIGPVVQGLQLVGVGQAEQVNQIVAS